MNITEQLLWYDKLKDSPSFMAESNKINFAYEIEKAIATKEISQIKLAKIIGVSPAYISKVLRGDANLTIETMTKFADAIGKCLHLYLANKGASIKWVVESFSNVDSTVSILPKGQIKTRPKQLDKWIYEDQTPTYGSALILGRPEISNNVN